MYNNVSTIAVNLSQLYSCYAVPLQLLLLSFTTTANFFTALYHCIKLNTTTVANYSQLYPYIKLSTTTVANCSHLYHCKLSSTTAARFKGKRLRKNSSVKSTPLSSVFLLFLSAPRTSPQIERFSI